MDQVVRNEILKKVGVVLQFCQEIVMKLSSPQCNHNTSEYESLLNMSDIMTKNSISDFDSEYDLSDRSSSESSMSLQRWPTYYNITEVAEVPLMSETTMPENVLMQQSAVTEDVRIPSSAVKEDMRIQRPAKTDNVLMQSVFQPYYSKMKLFTLPNPL